MAILSVCPSFKRVDCDKNETVVCQHQHIQYHKTESGAVLRWGRGRCFFGRLKTWSGWLGSFGPWGRRVTTKKVANFFALPPKNRPWRAMFPVSWGQISWSCSPWTSVLKRGIPYRKRKFDQYFPTTWKRGEIGCKLVFIDINRKSHMGFQLVPNWWQVERCNGRHFALFYRIR